MAKSYSDKLKDPRWQRHRLECYSRDNFTCLLCGDSRSTLHAHHDSYQGEPWDIPLSEIRTLCEHCHSITHELIRQKITKVIKQQSLSAKCWECVAFTETNIIFLYLFYTSHKVEIITVFTNDKVPENG